MAADSDAYIFGSHPERSSTQSYDEDREETLWKSLERLAAGT